MKNKIWNIISAILWIIELPFFLLMLLGWALCIIYMSLSDFHTWLNDKYFGKDKPYVVTVKNPVTNEIVNTIRCKNKDEADVQYNDYFAKGYNVTISCNI